MAMTSAPLTTALRRLRIALDTTEAPDAQLVRVFAERQEEAAFLALLKRHGPMVLGVCQRLLRHEQDAEDVFQATFLLLAKKADSIRKQASVGAWLHGVAHRLALRLRAQGLCRKEHEQTAADMRKHETGLETAWQELQTALDESLQGLPENYRAALVLCYLEGRTHEEAAQQLRCPVGTVRSRVARGRDQLRKHLARRGLNLSAGAF